MPVTPTSSARHQAPGASLAGNAGRNISRNATIPIDSSSIPVMAPSASGTCRRLGRGSSRRGATMIAISCASIDSRPPTWNRINTVSAARLRLRRAAPSTASTTTIRMFESTGRFTRLNTMVVPE